MDMSAAAGRNLLAPSAKQVSYRELAHVRHTF